jgi:hypothetical protein
MILVCLTAALLTGCGGGASPQPTAEPAGSTPSAPPEGTPSVASQGAPDEPGGGQEGSATVEADGVQTELGVDDCTLVTGTILVVATAPNASLSLVGTAGLATIEFNRDGDQWIAAGAPITIDGSRISFEGEALKTGASPPDAQLSVDVTC